MQNPAKISGVVITFNEEKELGRCLQSLLPVVDELVVVDSFSTDKTEEIAQKYGARFIQNPFDGHIQQKNFAAQQAKNDWILSLDADEALSDTLAASICQVRDTGCQEDGYSMNRLNLYAGKWVKHGNWYPDRKVRLFNRRKAEWGGDNPHDIIVMQERTKEKHLKGDLLHYTYSTQNYHDVINEHMRQLNFFASKAAESAYQRGKRTNRFLHLWIYPGYTFFQEYILKRGFMDGFTGFQLAMASAWHKYLKYLKLWAITQEKKGK